MAVFFSFHYGRDAWRVQQVTQMGALEGQTLLSSQDWEAVKRQGDDAIRTWIDKEMAYKNAIVVLVGAQTASRPWVSYEIAKAWKDKRALVGVRIHGLADASGNTDHRGANPFDTVKWDDGRTVANYATLHDPVGSDSKAVYDTIRKSLASWVASAYKPS